MPYYSYPFVGYTNSIGEKNHLEVINTNIEPTINFVSNSILNNVQFFSPFGSNDNELVCFQDYNGQVVCLDRDDLDSNQINQLLNGGSNIQCFETKDDETVCLDQNNLLTNNVNNPFANNNNNNPFVNNKNVQCIETNNDDLVCFDTSRGSSFGNTGNSIYGFPQ